MKKLYESPEFEVLRCELVEDVMAASGEIVVPDQEVTTGPGEIPVIPDDIPDNF